MNNNLFVSSFFFTVFYFAYSLQLTSYFLPLLSIAHAAAPAQVCFEAYCLTVEVAADEASRMRGLQGRSSLPPDAGMLFEFPVEDVYGFWMKDTLIPLDMIWLDTSRRVVDVKTNVPVCTNDPCPTYQPIAKALYVIEANAGYAKEHGILAGTQAVFK